ncbi:MAG: type II toxin-antitoxin system VapC family toxin [Armatimonadetes bacterium]|nr:type II toxin-antitoxin system VapC family toxin [Armatimonadota bacterium]
MKKVAFDACAILAWLWGERGAVLVSELLREVAEGRAWGAVCSINLGEVYYRTCREKGPTNADSDLQMLRKLPWQVVPASDDLVWAAARLKAQYPISYADAFALACAQHHDAVLVTNDPELVSVEHGTPVLWGTDEAAD